jgi:hypothetical protein
MGARWGVFTVNRIGHRHFHIDGRNRDAREADGPLSCCRLAVLKTEGKDGCSWLECAMGRSRLAALLLRAVAAAAAAVGSRRGGAAAAARSAETSWQRAHVQALRLASEEARILEVTEGCGIMAGQCRWVLLAGLGFVLQTVGVVVVFSCFVAKANHHHDGKSLSCRFAHAGRKRREHLR